MLFDYIALMLLLLIVGLVVYGLVGIRGLPYEIRTDEAQQTAKRRV